MSRNPIKSFFHYLVVGGMIISFLTACDYNNEDKAIRQMCEEIHEHYPMATLQDVYKTCYQDYFGAEHLMSDTAAARNYLSMELEACRNTDMSLMPKREQTGFRHRFTRVKELQAELQEAAQNKQAVRHSEAFRNTYNPHYRIVRHQ